MYQNEQPEFEQMLYVEGDGNGGMWEDLRQALVIP
jgi:hypothetical protein